MAVAWSWVALQVLLAVAQCLVRGALQDALESASPGNLKVLMDFDLAAPGRNSVTGLESDATFASVTPAPGVDASDSGLVHVAPEGYIDITNHGIKPLRFGSDANRWTIMMDLAIDGDGAESWTGLYGANMLWYHVSNGFEEIGHELLGWAETEMLAGTFYRLVVTANLKTGGRSRIAYYLNGRLIIDTAGQECRDCQQAYALGGTITILPRCDQDGGSPARLTTLAIWGTDLAEEAIVALGPPSLGAAGSPQCAAMDLVGALLTRPALPSPATAPGVATCGRTCCRGGGRAPCREVDTRWRYNAETGECEPDPLKEVCRASTPRNEPNIPYDVHPHAYFGVRCAPLPGGAAATGELVLGFVAPDVYFGWPHAAGIAFFAAVRYFLAGHVIPAEEIHPALQEVFPVAFYVVEESIGSDIAYPGIGFIPTLKELLMHPDIEDVPVSQANLSRTGTVYYDVDQVMRGPGRPPAPVVTVTAAWEELCEATARAGFLAAGPTGTDGTGFTLSGRCMPTTLNSEMERDVGFGYVGKCKQWKLLFRELGVRKFGYIFADYIDSISHRFRFQEAFFAKCFERCAIRSETLDSELLDTCLQDTAELCVDWEPSPTCLPFDAVMRKMRSGTVAGGTQANDIRVLLFGIGPLNFAEIDNLYWAMYAEGVTADSYQLLFYGDSPEARPLVYGMERDGAGDFLDGAIFLAESCDGPRWDDFAAFLGQLRRSDFPEAWHALERDNGLTFGDEFWGVGINPNRDFGRLSSSLVDGGGAIDTGIGTTVDATVASLVMLNYVLTDLGQSVRRLPYFVLDEVSRKVSFPGVCGGTVSFDDQRQRPSVIKMKVYSIGGDPNVRKRLLTDLRLEYLGSVTESAFTRHRPNRFYKGSSEIVVHLPPYCAFGHEALDDLRCHRCKPGFYSSKQGRYLKCLPCEPGTFADMTGSVSCSACAAGTIAAVEGMTACRPCEAGRFQPAQRKRSCISCGPGTIAGEPGAERCLPCPRGSYQELEGQEQCDPCMGGRETVDIGAPSSQACRCPPGKYLKRDATCTPCPSVGLVCPGGDSPPLQAAGYAAIPAMKGDPPVRVVECQDELSCPEGLPMGECPEHRFGMACGRCLAGYAELAGRRCQLCEERGFVAYAPLLFGILAFVCLLGIVVAYAFRMSSATYHQSWITVLITLGLVTQALQAISAFATISITWVEPVASLQRVLAVFTLDVFTLQCSLDPGSEVAQYVLTLIAYPAFAASAQLLFLLSCKLRPSSISFDDQVNAQGVVLMLSYLPILLISLKPWQCNPNPDETFSVKSMANVQCWGAADSQHTTMLISSFFSLSCFCLGYVALASWAVVTYPSRVVRADGGRFLRRFRFLFYHFSVPRYYYASILSARSLAMALVPVLFTTLPTLQLMFVLITVLSTSSLQTMLFPWRSLPCNFLDMIISINLALIVAAGLLLSCEQGKADSTVQVCLYFYLVCIMIACLVVGSAYVVKVLFPRKPFGVFMCHHKAGAGAMARWLKIELGRKVMETVFLDSDNLHHLDTLFHMVAYQVRNLIVLLTRDILTRPWCAGEMATAVKARINIIPVACGDFAGFTDDAIAEVGSSFTGSDVTLLSTLGVSIPMIREALRQIRTLTPLHINRCDPYIVHEQLVDKVLKRCQGVRRVPVSTSRREVSTGHQVVILGGRHPEGLITCHIIRMLLQTELQQGVTVLDCPLDEAVAQTRTLSHILVVLAPGVLHDLQTARYLLLLAGVAKLLGVRADDSFCFPDEQFWCDLSNGLVLDRDTIDVKLASDVYRRLFATIATSFTPHASSRVHEAEIRELVNRMRTQSEPQHSSSISSGSAGSQSLYHANTGDKGQEQQEDEDEDEGAGTKQARVASIVAEASIPGIVPGPST